jgi:hypothetical protein
VQQSLKRLQDKGCQREIADFLHFKITIEFLKLMIQAESRVQLFKNNQML